jgi:hypothetical protein
MNPTIVVILTGLTGVIGLFTGILVTKVIMVLHIKAINKNNSRNKKFRELLEMVPNQREFFAHQIEMMEKELNSQELENAIQDLMDTIADYSQRGMEESAFRIDKVLQERISLTKLVTSAIETIKKYDETCNSSLADAGSSLLNLAIANHAILDLNQGEKKKRKSKKKMKMKKTVVSQEFTKIGETISDEVK